MSALKLPRLPWRILRQLCTDYTRVIKTAPQNPRPDTWKNDALTVSWLGHSTVLVNFYSITILTDPVFSACAGLHFAPFTIGPKCYVEPALKNSL